MPFSNPFRRTKKSKPSFDTRIPQQTHESEIATKPPAVNGKQPAETKLLFHAQLAHGSPTVRVGGFSNIRELYQKIADSFNIPFDQIIFCTLNTHKCDMDRLLGGQIGMEDFIFAHIKGAKKEVILKKTEIALGLTITDNGTGYPFVKRIKENSIVAKSEKVLVGDLIESIDLQSTIGCRHFNVAKLLKDIPLDTIFKITLVEPQKAFEMISQRSAAKNQLSTNNIGSGRSTLRLRSKGPATVEALPSANEDKAMHRIDDLLDSFLGIRDMELASTIWECGKNKKNSEELVSELNQQLEDFGFPQEFFFDIWGIILDARKSDTAENEVP